MTPGADLGPVASWQRAPGKAPRGVDVIGEDPRLYAGVSGHDLLHLRRVGVEDADTCHAAAISYWTDDRHDTGCEERVVASAVRPDELRHVGATVRIGQLELRACLEDHDRVRPDFGQSLPKLVIGDCRQVAVIGVGHAQAPSSLSPLILSSRPGMAGRDEAQARRWRMRRGDPYRTAVVAADQLGGDDGGWALGRHSGGAAVRP